ACSGIHTFADYTGNRRRGRDYNGEIYFLRKCRDIRMTANAKNFGAMRIDGVNPARKLSGSEMKQDGAPDAAFAIGGADHSYRVGPKERIEGVPGSHFMSTLDLSNA